MLSGNRFVSLVTAIFAAAGLARAGTEFGNITVVQPSSTQTNTSPVTLSIAAGGSSGFTLPTGSNRGDYNVSFGNASDVGTGVLIPSISQNGRDNSAFGDPAGTFYSAPTASTPNESSTANTYKISPYRGISTSTEFNVNVSFGFFPYNTWLGGLARNSANNGLMTSVTGSAGINLGTQFVNATVNGTYTLNLTSLNGSSASGILLVSGGKDENNYALSRANADGTFTIYCHDIGTDGGNYENDPVSFVYLPVSAAGTNGLAALGRVNSDATTDVGVGTFTLAKGTAGLWYLTIPGHNNTTGTLLVSPDGGVSNNADNILSYEWDAVNSRWVIMSRDLKGSTTESTAQDGATAGEDMFSFAFFTTLPVNIPPTVSITAPASGTTYVQGSPVNISATASDVNGGTIAKVEFFDGSTKLGESTVAPYTFSWSSGALGQHSITAKATDDGGATATSSAVLVTVTPPAGTGGLFFDGADDYVTFGNNSALGLAQFTLECWFRRDGTGVSSSSGSGGVSVVPLISKGRGENDSATFNCNYLFGIRASDNVLAADFEEGPGGGDVGLNHPVAGTTPITSGVWHHAAATYDGTTWRLYLDGNLEATLVVGQPPAFDTIQHAAIGAALNSTGTREGGFLGAIDEVRVWNVARTGTEIAGTKDSSIVSSTGLVARFGMDESTGTTLSSTSVTAINGTLTNGPVWVDGKTLATNVLPTVVITQPASGITVNPGDDVSFEATASDLDGTVTKVEFYDGGTKIGEGSAPPYILEWVAEGYGVHTFTARATDSSNSTGVSDPITVAVRPPAGGGALYFDGVNDYVTFGDSAPLKLAAFTLETWVRREAGGAAAGTGSGGTSGLPLIAKGRGENDDDTLNCNYFLGINPSSGVLVADFEEGPGGTTPGLNHPVVGTTAIPVGEWHHVAATYDGNTWKLYVDGVLDTSLVVGQPVASNSIQHASLGSALNSTGVPEGFLHGFLDEPRVWNSARTVDQIRSTMNSEVASASGLIGRWSLAEGTGTSIASSTGTTVNGTLTNGPLWTTVTGELTNDIPPSVTLVSPAANAVNQPQSVDLHATVTDPDSSSVNVTFYARPTSSAVSGSDFTIIALPDTQYYSAQLNGGTAAIFSAQTDWIVSEMNARNIQFVLHLGDVVDHGDNNNGGQDNEWEYLFAKDAMYRLENPSTTFLAEGLPYSVAIGNHDQSPNGNADGTSKYWNKYFGVHPTLGTNHFTGKSYYGGTQVAENADNNFTLFSAGGLDFICISMEYDTSPDAADLAWADSLLKAYPSRRGIVVTHWTVNTGNPASFSTQGSALYNALKNNPNLMMLHGGHIHGEGRRTDTYAGRTVHSILADYQGRTRGGDGWLRIMTFSPANNVVHIKTYSPTLNQFETDADSQFDLTIDLQSGLGPFTVVGTQNNVTPGTTVTMPFTGLAAGTRYEWYATASDANTSIQSSTRSFTTGGVHYPPTVSLTSPANGSFFNDHATITLEATAADADGTVSKVQFFSGSTLIGEDTTAPYSATWSNVSAGSYVVVAKAYDDENQVTTSEPVSIQVLQEPAAPSTAHISTGLFNSGWVVAASSPAPYQFDTPGTDVGDIELKINGSSVVFNNGITLAANWNNAANGAITSDDNIVAPYSNGTGNVMVSVVDNTNNNAAGSNPSVTEQSTGTAVAFLPYAEGWTGAAVGLNGNVLSSRLPAGVTVSRTGTGLYKITGLSVQGNLLAVANGDNGTTNGDNVLSVRTSGGDWVIDVRDNGNTAQDGDFSFVYIPPATPGVYAGSVSSSGALSSASQELAALGATITVNADSVDILIGHGSVVNPTTAALFLTGDSQVGGTADAATDNLYCWSANGNAFRVFSQDLPELTGAFQAAAFRFLALPLAPVLPTVTITATDNQAGEYGADQALSFTITRSGSSATALQVPLNASGTASTSADLSGFSSPVTIAAGSSTAVLNLTVLSDNLSEGDETLVLTLGTGSFVTGTPATASATIHDRPSQDWYAQNIPNPAMRGPGDDADGDGVANALEYFMGTQPGDGTSAGATSASKQGESATFRFVRALDHGDVAGAVEWSANLTNWYRSGQSDGSVTVNITENVVSASGANPEVIDAVATASSGTLPVKLFFRLAVTP